MKVKLLILLSFVSGLLIAQSKKEFPDDMELLGLKIEAVVKADNQPSSALLYNRFLDRYVKFDTVEVSNLARLLNNLKFNTKIDRNEYLLVIETIVKLDSASFLNRHSLNDYLSAYNKDVELFKSKNQKIAYVRDNYHIVLNRSFPGKKDLFWNSSKPLFFKPVKGSVAFEFDDVLLQGKRGAEVINFKNFKGNYLVYNRQFILKESVINWDEKFFSPDSLRVDLRNITFSADDGSIDIDTCVLNSLYFTKGKILGKLKLKLQSEESNAAVYPFFESHSYDFEYINMVDQVDFTGGIRITKNLFYGVSPKDSRAKLVLKRGGERKIVLQSKGFIFKHKNLQSISSDISIVIKEDSIYHPDVSFNYMVDQGKLVVMKTDSKMSNSAYSNSYSNLDMFIKNLTWIRDRDKVYFNTEDYNRIPFVSGKYFEREIVKRFQGVNHTNPLEKLQEVSSYYWEQDYYSSQNVADYMRMPKTYAVHMIMDLASLGYLIYDQDLDRFKFTPKFDHLVDSYKNRVDYDVITFETAEGASSRGQIDLQSGETLLLGIDRANLSNTKQVYVFPSDSVKVRENLNFAFNGDIIVGNYEFHGSDYNFDYEDFKIKMNGNQRLEFYVPSWKANSNGQYAMVKVRNPIDSIRGELFIDNPSNKSGRFKLDEFPIFNNTQQAYVFYDQKSIKDCVYTRQRLFVKLYPFELDSLNYKSSRDVSFQASLYAKDIFPVFDHQLSVQSDYVLGFQYDTDSLGLPLYEKGNFTHRLSLDGSGLNGIGKVDYLSSSFLSNQIEIYSDSLRSKTISYRIDKVKNSQLDFPPIAAKNVDVLWRPKQDSVYLRPLRQDFEMYQGSVKKSGELLIADKRLSGGGKVSFETAELNSKSYNFYSDNFESDTLDFKLRDNVRSPFKFAIKNAKGKVDLLNREGVFALNQKLEKIHFIQNKYLAQMDQVNWHIDQKSIDLRASDMVQDPKFTSTSPKLDSLSFSARIARYDLVKDRISASMVENLYVADAQIIPDSARLDIMDNGWMEGFENAILRIGIGKYEHRLTNANVIVESANKYTAKAEYFYIDVDKIVHPIHLSDIYVDNNQKTVANGIINFEDNFMLNPYFKYYGKVQVTGKSPLNNFEGFVGIVNNCENIQSGEIPINDFIDPEKVRMRVNNFQDNPRFKNIFSGIYSGQNGYSASFLLPDNSLEGKRLISAHGSISYDEINAAYQVGNDTINGVLQDRVVFFNDECRMSARGELHFDKSGMVFDLKSFGELDFDLNSNTLKANALMAVDFAMDQRLMQAIASDFENSAPSGNFQLNSEISDYTLSRLSGRVISSSALGEIDIFSGRNNANTDLQYPILLENVKLTWDSENNAFVSDDQLYLNHFDKRAINKFFKGKVELLKVGSNYELTVYLINDEGKYYYFRFVGDVVDFYTDQKSAMDMFDGISERDKELSFKGKKMRFKKASRLKVATFQRKYVF